MLHSKVEILKFSKKSQIDFILTRREHISKIKDCSTFEEEESMSQHKLLRGKLKVEKKNERKEQRESRIKVWKLKDEKLKMEYKMKIKGNFRKNNKLEIFL